MKTTPPPRHRQAHAFGRLLGAMFGVLLLGVVYSPTAAATTAVAVDQQPLTLQPPIPPNVMLMLDDSGSMAWDYMPDACYLNGVKCSGTNNGTTPSGNGTDTVTAILNNDALIDASNNGVYYNPTVTYTAPPKADGTFYPSQTAANLIAAPINGFNSSSTPIDLTNYTHNDVRGEATNDKQPLSYSASNVANVASSKSYADPYNPVNKNQCDYDYQYISNQGGTSNVQESFTSVNGLGQGTCVINYTQTTPTTFYFFQYSMGPAAGPYTVYYVSANASNCQYAPTPANCVGEGDATGAAAPSGVAAGQNIANWFAYYHTRIQMAKSGLMTAFSTVNKKFRVGFGSIDGGANGDANNLPASASSVYTYTDAYNSVTNTVASVQPFGDGTVSNDQKHSFWKWVAALSPSGGTPLREALDAIGQYYETPQPWTTMSSDPAMASSDTYIACRQSYTILTTDGFWNGNYTSGTTQSASDTSGPTVPGPNGQSYTYNAAAPYSGGDTADGSPSLADVAMYYWKTDLQAAANGTNEIANEVPQGGGDTAFWQHMTTFTMGLGFKPTGISGTATSNGDTPPTISDIFDAADGSGTLTGFSWPTPASNSIYNISDLAHAGVNGHGGFYSATSPQTFSAGLTDALARAAERVGTGASLAANSTQLTNGTVAYQATYYTNVWKGDLKSLAINSSTGVISATPTWTASTMLGLSATISGTVRTYPNRTIVTYNPSAATGSQFVSFQDTGTTPPTLSPAELNALGSTSAAQAAMVNYLRGDNTLEQKNSGTFRDRAGPLGDIVSSQPVFSGAPNPNEFENENFTGINAPPAPAVDNSFSTWAVGTTNSSGTFVSSAASQRTPLVFVAANDGMLHAFNANTGAELYAYLPGAVITGDVPDNGSATTFDNTALATLANPSYGSASSSTPHQYYNDGELTIADAFFNSAWHTVLVGTTGRGPAEAMYALDITNATVNSSGQITGITPLWERSAHDGLTNSNYIGQMVGKPVIAKVADSSPTGIGTGGVSDWQVLIGNGYNSASGTAALLEFDLATGALNVDTTDTSAGNGLAAPVAWMDDASTGVSARAYAGDLLGRVWMFPLTTVATTGGKTPTTTYTADLNAAGSKVFTATDPSGAAQPITGGMIAGRDATTGNVWVFFGTGRYLSATDLAGPQSLQVQSWYGVIARTGGTTDTLNKTNSSLKQRAIIYEQDGNPSATPPTLGMRAVTPTPTPSDMSGELGWYMNLEAPTGTNGALVAQGERMVTPNQFQGNVLLGTTRIPLVNDICNPSGSGWVMAVNPFTGTNPSANFFLTGGSTVTFTLNGKSVTMATAGVGFSSLPNNPIFVGGDMLMSFDNGTTSSLMTTGSTGALTRVSWQELVNP